MLDPEQTSCTRTAAAALLRLWCALCELCHRVAHQADGVVGLRNGVLGRVRCAGGDGRHRAAETRQEGAPVAAQLPHDLRGKVSPAVTLIAVQLRTDCTEGCGQSYKSQASRQGKAESAAAPLKLATTSTLHDRHCDAFSGCTSQSSRLHAQPGSVSAPRQTPRRRRAGRRRPG